MHKESQDLLKRVMGISRKPKHWTGDNISRFIKLYDEKAFPCNCGCGEKVNVRTGKELTLKQLVNDFIVFGSTNIFSEYAKNHSRFLKLEIDENLHQDLISAKLGDGSISYGNKNSSACRVRWNMGNKEHALEKLERFKKLNPTYTEKENPGFGSDWYCVVTKSHPALNKYYNMSFEDCLSQMNWYGLAAWYGDDGHLNEKDSICYLHTECMTFNQVKNLTEILKSKFDIDAAVHSYIGGLKKREMHCIRLKKGASDEFMAKTKDYMAKGMEYKNIYCS